MLWTSQKIATLEILFFGGREGVGVGKYDRRIKRKVGYRANLIFMGEKLPLSP